MTVEGDPELLQTDARLTPGQIAVMLGRDEEEVACKIKEMEENKIILGYFTLINWDKVGEEMVSAIIEVKLSPSGKWVLTRWPSVFTASRSEQRPPDVGGLRPVCND